MDCSTFSRNISSESFQILPACVCPYDHTLNCQSSVCSSILGVGSCLLMEVPKCIRIYIVNNRFAIYTIFYLQIALFKMQRWLPHWDTTWFRISQIHLIGVTTMLMKNVGDSLCCWLAWDVSDGFFISKKLPMSSDDAVSSKRVQYWTRLYMQE